MTEPPAASGGTPSDRWPTARGPLWDVVPDEVRAPPPPAEPEPVASRSGRRRRLPWVVGAVLVVALAAWAGWATYAMRENEQRTLRWQQRAQALQVETDRLDGILAERTRALNVRVDQLNGLGARLATAQAALTRSEGDVSSLEERQRQLANEKAQVEDQARILDGVAGNYVRCKQDLVDLLSDVANDLDATSTYSAARSSCANADAQLQAYLGAF